MIPDTNNRKPRQCSTGKPLLGTGSSRCFFEPSGYLKIPTIPEKNLIHSENWLNYIDT
jgi:hypothetical protein